MTHSSPLQKNIIPITAIKHINNPIKNGIIPNSSEDPFVANDITNPNRKQIP